jgi:hypothetical protein
MALLEIDMVKMEEIFLPYMVTKAAGETFFEATQKKNYQQLESGEPEEGEVIHI